MTHVLTCSLPGFFAAREWCWSQWGPGCEAEHWMNLRCYTDAEYLWCWHAAKWRGAAISSGRIYLATDQQLTQFSQAWQ